LKKEKTKHAEKHYWHPAFLQAIQHELFDYLDFLEFKYEYQLTSEPLRIDLLIIKKPKDLVIKKNIGRIFKAENIIEYKSPDDYLSIKDFLKVYAYANLYAAITPDVEFSDITLTFIESRYPRDLIKYLTNIRHYKIEETSKGIYNVQGDYLPIQIIESKKLSDKENLWLRSLKYGLEIENADAIIKEGGKRTEKVPLDTYLYILLKTNARIFKELQHMAVRTRKKRETFEEVFTEAGIIPEWMERGFKKGIVQGREEGLEQGNEEGREKARIQIAKNLLAKGSTPELVQEITGLSLEKINSDIFKELHMAVKTKKQRRTFVEVFTEAGIIPEWIEQGFKKGIVQGREEGLEQGNEEGREKARIQIAKNLLAEGSTYEFIHKITGLGLDKIKELNA